MDATEVTAGGGAGTPTLPTGTPPKLNRPPRQRRTEPPDRGSRKDGPTASAVAGGGLTKSMILEGGSYLVLPAFIASRDDLRLVDKAIYAAVLFHFRGDATFAATSEKQLASVLSLGRRTVQLALGRLQEAGLITVEKRSGRPAVFRLCPPSNKSPTCARRAQVGTKGPAHAVRGTGARGAQDLRTTCAPSLEKEIQSSPQSPPAGGGSARDVAKSARTGQQPRGVAGDSGNTSAAANGARGDPATPSDREILDRIDAAHQIAFGVTMTNRWRRRLKKGLGNGSRELILRIDAEALRRAQAFAKAKGISQGVQTVLNCLLEEAAGQAARRRTTRDRKLADHECPTCGVKWETWMIGGRQHVVGTPCEHAASHRHRQR